jgi:prolyl oligopeptidase
MHIDERPTLSAPDDDPYLWLESISGQEALEWVGAQNAKTVVAFGGDRFEADRDALAAILDRPDNLPYVSRRGQFVYNFWKDAHNPKGLWRRTTLADFRTDTPAWETVLDLDALAASEGEDWIWHGASTLPGSHGHAILRLSPGGGDAIVLREFDIEARDFVRGGFELPEAKGSAEWLDLDTLLVSSALGEDRATNSGYARTVRLWQRGQTFAEARTLFETAPESIGVWVSVDRTRADETIGIVESIGFFDVNIWFGAREAIKTKLDLPTDIAVEVHKGWLAVKRRTDWEIAGKTHPADTLLGISLENFLAGGRGFTVLFEPGPRRSIQYFFWANGKLIVSVLDDLRPVFDVLTPGNHEWTSIQLTGLPSAGIVHVEPIDSEESESNGDLVASAEDPLTPVTLLLFENGGAPQVLKRAPGTFNSGGSLVTRHDAISVDGERIPYFQVGPAGATGDAPVHLYGYGGFGLNELPHYDSAIGKLWLERGGTRVTACLRGGGEFGSPWHEAGKRAGKRLSHDDFAAVATDLVRRGVTVPKRIAAEGGSNGGVLISNMLTRYPERFGALLCTIPLIDMRRYSKLLAGASWIDEYGDPDKAEDWEFLKSYSAYHAAEPGRAYPPILLATFAKDDRVHPGHARKMAAKLQAMNHEAYFYEPPTGGHGYGKDNKERASFTALGLKFLREKIGWTPD